MKKALILSAVLAILVAIFIFASNNKYRDGKYKGISRSRYTHEEFYGISKVIIEKGKFTKVDFCIIDSAKHEIFDENYFKHFTDNPEYTQQCRENWAAMQSFPDELLKLQDIDKIDAVSGATWACNIFKASAKEAIKEAKY
jgi:major membrane immunogen (membrane-anchored lipoprotein)